jgi:3-hydroxyisobutyrate dehydrogenase-like beta-hydroxyacid dehydrogenase
MTSTIAFFGLGEMGAPMAARLVSDGHRVLVKNRSSEKQDSWLSENDGFPLEHTSDLAGVDVVISCLGADADLRALYLEGEGLADNLTRGTLVIDHTTASAAIAQEIAQRIQSVGCDFLDAPVSGGSAGAQNGVLSVMVGGDAGAVSRADPILHSYSRSISHIGGVGTGQLCKMVNQLCIAGVLQGLAEGLALARAASLDTERVLAAISGGAAASWQMENRSSFMLSDTYVAGFAARLMHKDLGLCVEEAHQLSVPLPGGQMAIDEYSELIEAGFGDEDFSNLHRLIHREGAGA